MEQAELLKDVSRAFRRALESGETKEILSIFSRHLGLDLALEDRTDGEGMAFPVEDPRGRVMRYLVARPRDRALEEAELLHFAAHLLGWLLYAREQESVIRSAQETSLSFLTGEGEELSRFLDLLRAGLGVDSVILTEVVEDRVRLQAWAGTWPPQEELVEDAVVRARHATRDLVELPPEALLVRFTSFQRAWVYLLRDPEGIPLGALVLLTEKTLPLVRPDLLDAWKSFLLLGLDRRRWARITRSTLGSVVLSMVALEEMRDPYTRGHSERVARYAVALARRLGYPPQRIEKIYFAALLHDIGKVAIPDILLLKPTALQEHEMEIIRSHVNLGYEILRHLAAFADVAEWIRAHHERWDGMGYPRNLKGREIPREAQILAIADVFDALTSTRPYRRAYTREEALKILEEEAGRAFDPELVPVAVEVFRDLSERAPEKPTPLLYLYLDRVRKDSALSFAETGVLMNAVLRFWAEEPLAEILADVLDTTIRIFHFDGGFFRMVEGNEFVVRLARGVSEAYVQEHLRVPVAPFQGWIERGIQEGYLFFEDVGKSPVMRRFFRGLVEEGVVSLLVIPLYARHRKERIHGYLSFFNREPREVPPEQIKLLTQIGRHLGLLLDYREREEREELYQSTLLEILDVLRGSRNRGAVDLAGLVRFLGERAGLSRPRIRALEHLMAFVDLENILAPDLLRIKVFQGVPLSEEERAFLARLGEESRKVVDRLHLPEDWKEILRAVYAGEPHTVEARILYLLRLFRRSGEKVEAVEREVGERIPLRLFEDFREALARFQRPPEESRQAVYEDLYAFLQEISVLYEIGAHLEEITDAPTFAAKVLESVGRATGADSLFLLARQDGVLKVLAAWGFPEEVLGQEIPEDRGLVGRAARTGEPVLVEDTATDPEYIPPAGRPMGSALVVPLLLQEELVGVLAAENREPHSFSPKHVRFLRMLSRYIAPVVYLLLKRD